MCVCVYVCVCACVRASACKSKYVGQVHSVLNIKCVGRHSNWQVSGMAEIQIDVFSYVRT